MLFIIFINEGYEPVMTGPTAMIIPEILVLHRLTTTLLYQLLQVILAHVCSS